MRTADRTSERDWKPAFIRELARSGNVSRAAAKAKIARSAVYAARESDEAFARAWVEAEAIATEVMEAEAHRRAVSGVLKPVFQGGKKVGQVREYSDTLLMFLLKARAPAKYRENKRVVFAGDPESPVRHEHRVSITPDDIAFAQSVVAAAGARVPPDG